MNAYTHNAVIYKAQTVYNYCYEKPWRRMKPLKKKTKKQKDKISILFQQGIEENKLKKLPLIFGLAFAIVCGGLLATYNSEYLFRVQELSLFLPTTLFWNEQMAVPGGFLAYLGTFLTQFFYYPWLGTLFLIILWATIQIGRAHV